MYNYNNYPGYAAGPMMQPQSQLMQYNSQSVGLKGRPVSSIEEVRAAQIDFDGSLFVFPDVANKKIYTKQINLDGTASMRVYTQVDDTPPAPAYVTQQELESAIENLRQSFINGKEDNNGNESKSKFKTGSNNATITF